MEKKMNTLKVIDSHMEVKGNGKGWKTESSPKTQQGKLF